MNMYDIIEKKKNAKELSTEEIEYFVNSFTSGEIPDYQASALLMAICLKHMNERETVALTKAMMNSGEILDLSKINGIKADKHSTGGVGDKTTLVLAPLLAASGLNMAKMSGRALGHTGGTIDKLESFSGFHVELSKEEFIKQVNDIGIAVAAQTSKVAPADKKIYALRDVTCTVDNISLIASSIMSKKLACGADCIVLDVKTGSGAFMSEINDSIALAEEMVKIGKGMGRKICAVISDMDQPLGHAVGNALEVKEAVETLKGKGAKDLRELCLTLGEQLMLLSGKALTIKEARDILTDTLESNKAFEKFKEFISYQGGDINQAQDLSLLPKAKYSMDVLSDTDGYISKIMCKEIGMASLISGAGREVKEDKVDLGAGIYLHKKCRDFVKKGEKLATVYSSDEEKLANAHQRVKNAYTVSNKIPPERKLVFEIIK